MMDQRYPKILDDVDMTWNEFITLILIYEEQHEFLRLAYAGSFMDFHQWVNGLEAKGLIKWIGDDVSDIILRKKGEDLFKKHVGSKRKITSAAEVKQWIQSWRDVFPEGVNTGGFRYRGDKAECIKKMIKFINDHDYTLEQIFQATRNYVERFSLKGYAYMQQAHYFIQKQGVGSTLASECEALTENKPKEEGENYGRAIV